MAHSGQKGAFGLVGHLGSVEGILQKLLLAFFLPDFRDVGAGQKDELPLTVVVTVAQLFIPEDTILDGSGVEDVFLVLFQLLYYIVKAHKTGSFFPFIHRKIGPVIFHELVFVIVSHLRGKQVF